MIKYFWTIVLLLVNIHVFSKVDPVQLIKEEIQKSEHALVIKNRADQSIMHALKAQQLYDQWGGKDYEIARTIQLKFIGAFQKINHAEKSIVHLRKLQKLNLEADSFASKNFYLNTSRLANNYKKIGFFDSAYTHFQKALKSAIQLEDNLYTSSAINNIGMYYTNIGGMGNCQSIF